MQLLDLDHARSSLGRGLARQAMEAAALDDADTARILNDLHGLSPNARSSQRFAKRLKRCTGVVLAAPEKDGLVVVFRNVLDVTLRKDGTDCFVETRISWTRARVIVGRGRIIFDMRCAQVSRHVLQRWVERSTCALRDLLRQMDAAMTRALSWLSSQEPLRDRDDEYLPADAGIWAGGQELMHADPNWGRAFAAAPQMQVFAIRTFLGEDQMRPTVWLGWSGARGSSYAA